MLLLLLLKRSIYRKFSIAVVPGMFLFGGTVSAQSFEHDSSYYMSSISSQALSRFYFSRKYTNVEFGADDKNLVYRPNSTLNTGVGLTYRRLTLNLAAGLPFFNQNDDRGKTKYLDLQSHLYGKKWVFDLMGQFYKGYYLNKEDITLPDGNYYSRPDVGVSLLGLAGYRVLNAGKFSYRSAIIQDEWQLKSAGTFLLGAEIHYGRVTADSALIPAQLENQYVQSGYDRLRFFSAGPGVGYAYNLVLARHFFIMASSTINANVTLTTEINPGNRESQVSVRPNIIYRAAAGYNSSRWAFTVSYVGNRIMYPGEEIESDYYLNTGNYRATLGYRFIPSGKWKKILQPVDDLLDFLPGQ